MAEDPRKLLPEEDFLRTAVDVCRKQTIITDADIVTRFPPRDIMVGFKDRPDRRADLLGSCTGMKRATASRLPPEEAGHLLMATLDEGDTSPDEIFRVLTSEDLVRHHAGQLVWMLIFTSKWPGSDKPEHRLAMAALLASVIDLHLLDGNGVNTHYELVKAIGRAQFTSDRIPHQKRDEILAAAFALGEDEGKPFLGKTLFTVLPPPIIVNLLELAVLELGLKAVARKYGWESKPPEPVIAPPTRPVLDHEEVVGDDAFEGPPPSPAETSTDDGVLELDADEPSGVHPASQEPVPLANPPPGALDDGIFAGIPVATSEDHSGRSDIAGFIAGAKKAGSSASSMPISGHGDGGVSPMPTAPTPGTLPIPGGRPKGPPPPPPSSLIKRCQTKVTTAKEALKTATKAREDAERTRDRKFSPESELALTAAKDVEVAATEALKAANHELEEALKATGH